MASLKLNHVCKVYPGDVAAVTDFCLDIEDKEFIVLVGPSGCGKSTTLRMVAGLEEITEGEIYIGDRLVNNVAPKDRNISMVFQNYALYPHMTVYENMAFGLKLHQKPKDEIDKLVREAAKILSIEPLLNRKPKALSGGQRQRVALGRAIVRNPKVFLFDEPLSNLDAKLRVQMRTEITRLHQRLQTTFIYVTHDQTEAMTMATRIVVMRDGFIQQVDTPQNLYDYPENLFVGAFIGSPQMNLFDARLVCREDGVWAEFGDNAVRVPEEKVAKLVDPSYIGREVVMGIRPENIHDETRFLAEAKDNLIKTRVEVVEQMGSETYLYLKVAEKEDSVTARVDPRSRSHVGDSIKVAIEADQLHFFDKDTEKNIIKR